MTSNLWTYFLGGTIVNRDVVNRVQEYENSASRIFKKVVMTKEERHMTIVPPFLASYTTAKGINLKCVAAAAMPGHPLTTPQFMVRDLQIMNFEGLDILHFPIRVDEKTPGAEMLFVNYVKALRTKFRTFGIQFKGEIPNEYKPHITVCIGENIKDNEEILSLINESKRLKPLLFHSGPPRLYTKCKEGWGDLGCDPNV